MDTGLQLGSHWQLVTWNNCFSYFTYYSPINTAKNTFLARALHSWLMFSIWSCISLDLSDLTHQVQDSCHWLLLLACLQLGRERVFAVPGRASCLHRGSACQSQLVATICDSLTKAVPTANQHPEKMTTPVAAWSCARSPIMWMEVPDGSCPPKHPDVSLTFNLKSLQPPRSFPVTFLILWSSESSTSRKDSDGNFSSQNYQAWQLEGRSSTGGAGILQLLDLKPPKEVTFRDSFQTFSEEKALLREL